MGEAERKRGVALAAATAAGSEALAATSPATVRWLLCGRGRPVDASAPASPYAVIVTGEGGTIMTPDIEAPRVESEERFHELGYRVVAYAWHEGPDDAIAAALDGREASEDARLEEALARHRRELGDEERQRYRAAGKAAAEAMVAAIFELRPEATELQAAGRLAGEARSRGLVPLVVLVAGERRQKVHRHPLPTGELLGRHALLALTAEREGLHVSLTRLLSFGPTPDALAALVRSAAAVDAALLAASRPGSTLGAVFAEADAEYERQGFPAEWRRHHQGGLTGYRGREAFATPASGVRIPDSCAVAWNPSITGGAKSEDTALVGPNGVEVVTRTPELPELEVDGFPRPAVAEL